jgi:hypothetical protein
MARKGYHQREHTRTNQRGTRFHAGRRKAINSNLHLVDGMFALGGPPYYPGYSDDRSRWNGWECPYFTKEIAIKILDKVTRQSRHDGYDAQYMYAKNRDAFILQDSSYSSESSVIFDGETYQTPDGPKKLYSIGGWMWTWEKR